MKTIIKTVACISVALLAFSCTLTEIDTQMTAEQAIAKIRLEASTEAITVSAEKAQVATFKVFSTTPWTITGHENLSDWLTVSPTSSAESSLQEDIRVKVTANEGFEDRVATLTLSGQNTQKTCKIVITQLRSGRIAVEPVDADIPAAGGSVSFTVTTNLDWTVEAEDPWLTFSATSGEGKDLVPQTIQAKATANESVARTTRVTVKAGDFVEKFKVTQKGQIALDFVLDGDAVLTAQGGDVIVTVNAAMDWKAEADAPIVVSKQDDSHLKITAPWNKYFAPQKYNVTIKPTGTQYGDLSNTVVFTQDINFKFEGDCIVMDDGSVRIGSSKKAQIITKDTFRYITAIITLGDMSNFGDKGQLCFETLDAQINDPDVEGPKFEIMNQLILGTNTRFRTNGGKETYNYDTYDSKSYTIAKDDIKKLKEYKVSLTPNAAKLHMEFFCDGVSKLSWESSSKPSAFGYDPRVAGHYFFGYEQSPGDATWYIVKSFEIIPVAEN